MAVATKCKKATAAIADIKKSTGCQYIDDYIAAIRTGTIQTSKELKQAADYIERKLDNLDVFIDTEKIDKAIELIERYFDMKLLPWELFVLALVHCYYRSTDSVVFDEFYIMMGRGNGKNGFISGVAWYLSTHYHGVKEYNVDIIANSEDQAETSFNDIYNMLESTWEKSKKFFYKSKEEITNLKTRSYIKYNTSNARTKDGKRSACLIFDERHEYENAKNIGVFSSGFGKRKHSRIFSITTNGYVRDGVLDEDMRLCHDVLNGTITELGLCPLIYKMDSDEECDNPELWEKANPSLPFFPELRKQIEKDFLKKAYDKQTELDFYTKRMNLPRSEQEEHVTEWANVVSTYRENGDEQGDVISLPDLFGKPCVAGIDYARLNDFASVNLHFKDGDLRYDINHSWLCLQSADLSRLKIPWEQWARDGHLTLVDEKEIHPGLIAEWLSEKAKMHDIRKLAIDDHRYTLVTRVLADVGFDAKDRKNVVCVRPRDIMKAVPVVSSLFTNQQFRWGDNPPLRWAAWNTKVKRCGRADGFDTGNFTYAKIEAKSRKNDPWMALVHSMTLESELDTVGSVVFDDIQAVTW